VLARCTFSFVLALESSSTNTLRRLQIPDQEAGQLRVHVRPRTLDYADATAPAPATAHRDRQYSPTCTFNTIAKDAKLLSGFAIGYPFNTGP
jgi:hypothetical protein